MDKEKTESTAEHKQLQTFAEDAKDLFLLRQARAEDDGTRISLAEVEARLVEVKAYSSSNKNCW